MLKFPQFFIENGAFLDEGYRALSDTSLSTNQQTGIGGVIYFLLSMVVVIVLLLVFLYFLKRAMGVKNLEAQSGLIEVIASRMVEPRKRIQIIRIHNKILIIGQSESQMHLLGEFEDEEDIEFLIHVTSQSENLEFNQQLSYFLNWFRKKKSSDETE